MLNPSLRVIEHWECEEIICKFENAGLILHGKENNRENYDASFSFVLNRSNAQQMIDELQHALDRMRKLDLAEVV